MNEIQQFYEEAEEARQNGVKKGRFNGFYIGTIIGSAVNIGVIIVVMSSIYHSTEELNKSEDLSVFVLNRLISIFIVYAIISLIVLVSGLRMRSAIDKKLEIGELKKIGTSGIEYKASNSDYDKYLLIGIGTIAFASIAITWIIARNIYSESLVDNIEQYYNGLVAGIVVNLISFIASIVVFAVKK